MMHLRTPALLLLAAAPSLFGESKELVQIRNIQRDIALLQGQIKAMQQATDEKIVKLTTLIEQTLEATGRTNTSLASVENTLNNRLSQQLSVPIASVNSRVETMSTEFHGLRESVADLTERIGRIQTQLTEMNNTIRTLQAPPPPPGPTTSSTGPPAGVSPTQLYESALRDRSGGNLDLAMQGFQEYLKWFDNTELAPNAQFYIGQIHYDKNDFPNAAQAFDVVLEKYPENTKTADAMYMKGMALLKGGQRTEAGQEFLTVIQKYPASEVAGKARTQRRALGLSVPTTPVKTRRR